MKYSTSIDLSKVEDEYTLKAYANCSYKNKFIKTQANVSDNMSKLFVSNSEAIKTTLNIKGGSENCITSLQMDDSDANMEAWVKSLQNKQNLVVVNLESAKMIPLWELISDGEESGDVKGSERKRLLKEYMENGQMQRDFAADDNGTTKQMGQIAHITGLDKMFKEDKGGSLIKDLYIGSTKVARVCSEFIPKFSTTERSIVIYPVSDNWAKYNMGLFIGNKGWCPQYICWKNDGAPITTTVANTDPGMITELYLSGSSFYAPNDPVIKEATEKKKTDVTVKDAFMQGPAVWKDGSEHPHNYPIVKIFNRIWQRIGYDQKVNDHEGYYSPADVNSFTIKNWHMGNVEDYKNLMNGLTNSNISAPALYMSNMVGGEDLTGFSISWDGLLCKEKLPKEFDPSKYGGPIRSLINIIKGEEVHYTWKRVNGNNDQMEFMTRDKDGRFGHVMLKRNGSMEIVENNFNNDGWLMQVRMVQPLSVKKK